MILKTIILSLLSGFAATVLASILLKDFSGETTTETMIPLDNIRDYIDEKLAIEMLKKYVDADANFMTTLLNELDNDLFEKSFVESKHFSFSLGFNILHSFILRNDIFYLCLGISLPILVFILFKFLSKFQFFRSPQQTNQGTERTLIDDGESVQSEDDSVCEQQDILGAPPSIGFSTISRIGPTVVDLQPSSSSLYTDTPLLHFSQEDEQFIRESLRPNSELIKVPIPKCQVSLYTEDGQFVANGYRDPTDMLVTNYHALSGLDIVCVKGCTQFDLRLRTVDFKTTKYSDLAYRLIDGVTWSRIGAIRATYPKKLDYPVSVSISSNGDGSVGTIESTLSDLVFTYSGSTLPGFSGAVYMAGNYVVGIHLGAGSANIGLPFYFVDGTKHYLIRLGAFGDNIVGEKNKGKNKRNKGNRTRVSADSYIDFAAEECAKWGRKMVLKRYYNDPEAPLVYIGRTRVEFTTRDDLAARDIQFEIRDMSEKERKYLHGFRGVSNEAADVAFMDEEVEANNSFLVDSAPVQDNLLAGAQNLSIPTSKKTRRLVDVPGSSKVPTNGQE